MAPADSWCFCLHSELRIAILDAMRYEKVVKLYKNYELSTGTKRYLVGCYRNDGSALAEESYLRRAEKEPVEVWFSTEVESATLYPDLVAEWEKEDAERAEMERRMAAPYAIPLVNKPWPDMFGSVRAPGIRRQFPDIVINTYIHTADNAKSVMNFAKTLGHRRKRR